MDLSGSLVKSLDDVCAKAAEMATINRAAVLKLRSDEIFFFIRVAGLVE
jgi:hypothetical protein